MTELSTATSNSNLLVVSHGGLLKEIHVHLAAEWGVTFPTGFRRVPPNTGITRVEVVAKGRNRKPRVTCGVMHDNAHVKGLPEGMVGVFEFGWGCGWADGWAAGRGDLSVVKEKLVEGLPKQQINTTDRSGHKNVAIAT